MIFPLLERLSINLPLFYMMMVGADLQSVRWAMHVSGVGGPRAGSVQQF